MTKFDRYTQGTPSWIDLMAPDQDGAKRFYGDLFGWEYDDQPIDDQGNTYSMARIEGDDVAGLGGQMEHEQGQPARWNVYFAADDVDAVASKVQEAGGQVMAGPMDVFDSGRMAFAQDPGGAMFGIWQAKQHIGSRRANEPGTNTWNEVAVDDVPATAGFYREVLGVTPQEMDMGPEMGTYTTFEVDGRSVAGSMSLPPGVPPHWNVYFNVADLDASVARATDLGAEAVAPAMDIPGVGRLAFLKDPQGAMFNLMQHPADFVAD
ncbi:VOC family protein [Nocardioides donggukensis]|uniref:VOC family protein n=1 Tax=Nocardioides donggukensis TaxID=2774019 RepID=A0A927K367_9ACTN|nr:VOC family protein [Nocardioides donggukensis]MBD8868100.1 VOC family protein [Nocardioides donggukensis]